jgi:hypothetical protein
MIMFGSFLPGLGWLVNPLQSKTAFLLATKVTYEAL